MSSHKYPFISDKKMYAAVMGACEWIRKDGYFNKAVSYYASKYGVDKEELEKEIRKRQSAGQKGQKSNPRKYLWYIVETWQICEADQEGFLVEAKVKKATSIKNAAHDWTDYNRKNDSGSHYSPYRFDKVIGEYETEKGAREKLEERTKSKCE